MTAESLELIRRRMVKEFYHAADSLNQRIDLAKVNLKVLRTTFASTCTEFEKTANSITCARRQLTCLSDHLERSGNDDDDDVDRYLQKLVEKLINYGDSIRLTIYYVKDLGPVGYRGAPVHPTSGSSYDNNHRADVGTRTRKKLSRQM